MPLIGIFIYLVLMAGIYFFRIIPETRLESYHDFFIMIVCFLGSYYLYRVYRLFDKNDTIRFCWLFFSGGLFLEGCGYCLYSFLEWLQGNSVMFPSVADVPIIGGCVLYIISFWLYLYHQSRHYFLPSLSWRFAANTLFLVLLILHISFFVIPILHDSTQSLWLRLMYQIFPRLDIILAYFCLNLAFAWISRGYTHIAKPWLILAMAMMIFLITDYSYNVYVLFDMYHAYLWINPGWGLAYLLMAHAAYVQWNLMLNLNPLEEEVVLFHE